MCYGPVSTTLILVLQIACVSVPFFVAHVASPFPLCRTNNKRCCCSGTADHAFKLVRRPSLSLLSLSRSRSRLLPVPLQSPPPSWSSLAPPSSWYSRSPSLSLPDALRSVSLCLRGDPGGLWWPVGVAFSVKKRSNRWHVPESGSKKKPHAVNVTF